MSSKGKGESKHKGRVESVEGGRLRSETKGIGDWKLAEVGIRVTAASACRPV